MKGITYGDIMNMPRTDRAWLIHRLYKQLKKEYDDMKRARKGK